ncbi:MAG: hypothetical protein IJB95_03855, partial [Clostridia bacterium]|nr:hypothetical protein [Clostridia bacterium]
RFGYALSVAYGASSPKVGAITRILSQFLQKNGRIWNPPLLDASRPTNLIGGSKPSPYDMENILQVCTKK